MKAGLITILTAALAAAFPLGNAMAQAAGGGDPAAPPTPPAGRVVSPTPNLTPSLGSTPTAAALPPRPDRNERQPLSPEAKRLVNKFESDREAFLKQQEEDRKARRGTTGEEREMLRQRQEIRERREAWQEQAVQNRQEASRRVNELRRDVLPRHRKALEEARPTLNEKPKPKRPGLD